MSTVGEILIGYKGVCKHHRCCNDLATTILMWFKTSMEKVREIVESIECAKRIFITTHSKPDGDALGSCLGLCRVLRARGRDVSIVAMGPIPRRYRSFVGSDENTDPSAIQPANDDVLVVLDCGDLDRAPDFAMEWNGTLPVLNIDHHHSNSNFGVVNWVDASASSVGEMIALLSETAGWDIPREAAEPLWIAIITDTGRFAYSNTSPSALRCAAELVSQGLPTAEIDHRLYHSLSLDELRVQGQALANLEVHEGGAVALVSLSLAEFEALGVGPEATEDIVNIPRSLAGAHVAVFLYELRGDDGAVSTKVSLRTVEPYDAAAFCRERGGGGHQRAAGCTLDVPLSSAKTQVLNDMHASWFVA